MTTQDQFRCEHATVGSAGESLAAGITFKIPAFFIWAAQPKFAAMKEILGSDLPSWWLIFILSMLGGTLGILFMIPLRRYLVENPEFEEKDKAFVEKCITGENP